MDEKKPDQNQNLEDEQLEAVNGGARPQSAEIDVSVVACDADVDKILKGIPPLPPI